MPKKTDLTIIVLSYQTPFWLKKTLTTLKQFYLDKTKYKVKVIVVDNNSQDDSVKIVKTSFKWAEVIRSKENLGFAGGNNLALKNIDSRYSMLLNSDVELNDNSNLDLAIKYLDENLKVAVMTPKLTLYNGELDWASHRGEPTPWAGFSYYSKLAKIFPNSQLFAQYHQTYKDFDETHEIDACSGAAIILRTSAMEKVGLLDEQFFMYAEDLDWCKRFRDKNHKIIYFPHVQIIHHKYKSGIESKTRATSKKVNHYFYDTMLQYYDKHYAKKYPKFFRTLLKTFIFIKKGGD
jgi:GT2 family glycosyltransferase